MSARQSSGGAALKAVAIWILLYAVPLFWAAGAVLWWNAWAYLIATLISIIFVTTVVYRQFPDLAQERATARSNTKPWDKIVVPLVALVLPLASNIVAGLDKRFDWTTSIANREALIALMLLVAANGLIAWSMLSNRFFSSHFHTQTERGHGVVSGGPYAVVRHPGYAGMALGNLAVPVLLGSLVALWVGVANACLTVLRTALEDESLQAELPGYRDYARKVRFRLIPYIW
jgi:protein-S-isoprenylcysteine O-methyltransferase Ste14